MAISSPAMRVLLANEYKKRATHAALRNGDPQAGGAEPLIDGEFQRAPVAWAAASVENPTGTAALAVTAGFTVAYVSLHESEGNTAVLDKAALPEQTFSSAGTYNLTLTYQQF